MVDFSRLPTPAQPPAITQEQLDLVLRQLVGDAGGGPLESPLRRGAANLQPPIPMMPAPPPSMGAQNQIDAAIQRMGRGSGAPKPPVPRETSATRRLFADEIGPPVPGQTGETGDFPKVGGGRDLAGMRAGGLADLDALAKWFAEANARLGGEAASARAKYRDPDWQPPGIPFGQPAAGPAIPSPPAPPPATQATQRPPPPTIEHGTNAPLPAGAAEFAQLVGGPPGAGPTTPTPAFQPGRHQPATLNPQAAAFAQNLGESPAASIVTPAALAAGADPFYTGGSRNPSSYLPPDVTSPRPAAAARAVQPTTAAAVAPGVQQIATGAIPKPASMPDDTWAVVSEISAGLMTAGSRNEGLLSGVARGAQNAAKGADTRSRKRVAERREDRRDRLAEFDMALRLASSQQDPIKGSIEDENGEISLYTESGQFIPTGKKAGKKTTATAAAKEARMLATRKTTDELGLETEEFDRAIFDQMVTALGHPELRLGGAKAADNPKLNSLEADFKAGKINRTKGEAELRKMYAAGEVTTEEIKALLKRLGYSD